MPRKIIIFCILFSLVYSYKKRLIYFYNTSSCINSVKDLEDARIRLDDLTGKITLLTEQNAQCNNALALSETHHNYCAIRANEYGSKQFRLQLEKDALSKVYNDFFTKVREVSYKLISYSSDSKALVIPGSKVSLPEHLEMLANQANKQLEEFSQNIENQKTPILYESLANANGKKK